MHAACSCLATSPGLQISTGSQSSDCKVLDEFTPTYFRLPCIEQGDSATGADMLAAMLALL